MSTPSSAKTLRERPCAFRGCLQPFPPKTKNQIYCKPSHKVAEFNARKFDKAVKSEVRRRLRERRQKEALS